MGYQREQWHSGLTYCQTCETCKTVVQYTDFALDFRPWYADGFVDCPKCGNHLRHNEKFALGNAPTVVTETAAPSEGVPSAPFCSNCGSKFADGDRFCSQCGAKRN